MDLNSLTKNMVDALVAHIPGAVAGADSMINLPFGGMRAEARVERVFDSGIVQQHVWLTGGPLGARWVEDNFAGFGENPISAVVQGVHNWVEGNFDAVRRAFHCGGDPSELAIDGIVFDVYASPILSRGPRGAELAQRFDTPILEAFADQLPVLHPTGPSFVGTFLADNRPGSTTTEIKIDGADWPVDIRGCVDWPDGDGYVSVRQLAVLVPRTTRDFWSPASTIRRTLARLPASEGGANAFGAERHGYELTSPLLDAPTELPEDYRWFVAHVGESGAGPGYGLLPCTHPAQAFLREGTFDGTAPRGVLALAHHGCNAMALLVCSGDCAGQVWVDSYEGFRMLARSFREYYEDWLLATVRRGAAKRVNDSSLCALPNALSAFLTAWDEKNPGQDSSNACASLGDGSISTASTGDDYFDSGDVLDVCTGCVGLGTSLGLEPRHYVAGVAPKQGRPTASDGS